MNIDMEKRVAQFVQVRDALERLDEKQKAERKPLQELKDKLSGILQKFLLDNNTEAMRTAAGTCHLSTRYSAPLVDGDLFMKYVIEQKKFELIERRANSTAVRDFVQLNGSLPPGCNLTAVQTVGVRRKTGT